jgi:hypothetical protein
MEPVDALRAVETRLRLIITEKLGERWVGSLPEGGHERLKTWRAREAGRRGDHARVDDLIEYTMTGDLTRIITDNWNEFEDVFPVQSEFAWLMQTVESVRNTIAHNRALLPYERDLLSGAAGRINQLVAMHRARSGGSDSYFPRIERLVDSLGRDFGAQSEDMTLGPERVDVGSRVTLQCSSTPVRGKKLLWQVWREADSTSFSIPRSADPVMEAWGEYVEFTYEMTSDDVSERFALHVVLRTDSKHTRVRRGAPFDDYRLILYAVNPDD